MAERYSKARGRQAIIGGFAETLKKITEEKSPKKGKSKWEKRKKKRLKKLQRLANFFDVWH